MSDLRKLLRPETALVALALIAAIVLVVLFLHRGNAQQEDETLREKAAKTRVAIRSLSEEEAARKQQLEQLQAQVQPQPEQTQTLPSLADALDLSVQLTRYAAEQAIQISAFDTAQVTTPLRGGEHPAINYTLTAQGQVDSLIGLLALTRDAPTGLVKELKFSRGAEVPGRWVLGLGIVVVYEK